MLTDEQWDLERELGFEQLDTGIVYSTWLEDGAHHHRSVRHFAGQASTPTKGLPSRDSIRSHRSAADLLSYLPNTRDPESMRVSCLLRSATLLYSTVN